MKEYTQKLHLAEAPDEQSTLILVCYLTDNANTPDSRRIGILSTGTLPVMKFIANAILAGRVTYHSPYEDERTASREDQYVNFIADWNDTPARKLVRAFNRRLTGCELDTAINGRAYIPQATRYRRYQEENNCVLHLQSAHSRSFVSAPYAGQNL